MLSPVLLLLVSLMLTAGCQSAARQDADAIASLEQGQALSQQGHFEDALSAFNRALKVNPTLLEAHLGIGDIHRLRGDYAQAEQAYETAARNEPSSFDANYYLGLMNHLLGQLREAAPAYLQALAIDPQSLPANKHLAALYLQLGNPSAGLPYARRATKIAPDDQGAWANLAQAHRNLRQFDQAVDAYRMAAETGEISEPILLGLAEAQIELGRHELAANALQQLVRMNPSHVAYERLGYALFRQRMFTAACEAFELSLQQSPDYAAALNGLGACLMLRYIRSDRTDPQLRQRALSAWRRSLAGEPDQPRIVDLIARYQSI